MRRDGFIFGFTATAGAALFLLALYLCGRFLGAALNVIPPFVGAFAVALILEPLVERLVREADWMRKRRLPAVLVVYGFFVVVIGALLAFLVPILVSQASDLAHQLPAYVQQVRGLANDYLKTHKAIGPFRLPPNVESLTTRYSDQIGSAVRLWATRAVTVIMGSVSGLLNVVLVPIITFYLLVDLPRLRSRFLFFLPEKVRTQVQKIAGDVGGVFGNYVRGMVLVSVGYGLVAMVVFLCAGLKAYAILLGFMAGLLYAVPFVGPFVTALLSGVVYLATGHSAAATLVLLLAVLAENQLFDNLVVPRVVGDSVGLHPLLTLFALLLGSELFGLWGMLLSVPVAASVQVVLFRLFPRLKAPTTLSLPSQSEAREAGSVVHDAGEAEAVRKDTTE